MSNKKSEVLLGMIRGGQPMTGGQKLNLIVQLSIPSILAQITSVMMFFIDQAMVGRISVEAAAACGLVESSTWLCGSMTSAASMGFSVQVAHFIGANDFDKATSLKPKNANAHEKFGDALSLCGKEEEAALQWAIAEQLRKNRKNASKD